MTDRILVMVSLLLTIGCSDGVKQLTQADKQRFLAKGDEISTIAQQTLLTQVLQVVQSQGAARAVDYCHVNAIPLTDTLSENYSVIIQRLSDKLRNPDNEIQTKLDKQAWNQIKAMMRDSAVTLKHVLLQENKNIYYYKAIPLAIPACLMCHGKKNSDIAMETLKVIEEKYPHDLATGYEQGQLRGMWKIQMNANESLY
ncbi:MAG: DUF3365 domain-containing protein [Bacteroidia bacterium]|nr:DUF3365 domain-containing protein [Bacteroidia bacterium]MCZ2276946.1 DUF3365 domain-containing protein [Bacteroidia bacterium]